MANKPSSSSQQSSPSPDGALIATLHQSSLNINAYHGSAVRSISLAPDVISKCRFVRWSRLDDSAKEAIPRQGHGRQLWPCSRILLADDDNVRVYDVNDPRWSGRIERAASNIGKIADVAFGHTANELLVFSDFGVKLTIWSLITCRGVEIRDPKGSSHCYTYRAQTGHLAILTRPHAQDILMLLNPGDHDLVKSVELPTVDAQEVSWSPDGRWLAIRDAASIGHKLLIYTADGHLFKVYSGVEIANDIGLGIKHMKWSPFHVILALGDYDDKITILRKNSVPRPQYNYCDWRLTMQQFSPIADLLHSSIIKLPNVSIWQEQLDASKVRSYTTAPQPASPPTSTSLTKASQPVHGISIIAFNSGGSLLATKSDSIPTTIWIWSLQTGSAVAVLVHHSPVRNVSWHPTESDLLLIHCAIAEPAMHLWKSTWEMPQIVTLPLARTSGTLEASWLLSPMTTHFNLVVGSTHQYITCMLSGSGEIGLATSSFPEGGKSISVGAEDMFDEGGSLDLSPIKIAHDETLEVHDVFGDGNDDSGSGFGLGNELVDDTFHYRRHVRAKS